jgi:hypothetical protein
MKQTKEDVFKLAEFLIDSSAIAQYGENAVFVCMNALGITAGSTIEVDKDGNVVFQCDDDEVEQRIKYATEQKRKGVNFPQAMQNYFRSDPPLDPLAKFESANSKVAKTSSKMGRTT